MYPINETSEFQSSVKSKKKKMKRSGGAKKSKILSWLDQETIAAIII